MPRKSRIRLVGKRASFETEKWARAIEALAHQLRRPDAAEADPADQPLATPEDGRSC